MRLAFPYLRFFVESTQSRIIPIDTAEWLVARIVQTASAAFEMLKGSCSKLTPLVPEIRTPDRCRS
jgi:hypothetical protein